MRPNSKEREVQSQGVTASGTFGISLDDTTHIMTILRDTLYSDKVLAVLREYSSNAWDANREVGKLDVPINVSMPTALAPTLIIEDEGPGLSRDDVLNVYTQYGASTKRDSDLAVGMLGIGSKSGFAYSDSFTIVSRFGGQKSTYVAVLDESNAGTIDLLHEEPCEGTGVAVHIAIRQEDIREFEKKARQLFRHFSPRPTINMDLPPEPQARAVLANGAIHEDEYSDGWVAVMGCVPYRVNLDQLRGLDPSEGIGDYLRRMAGIIYFDIGEVEINASREELKYSTKTNKKIANKLNALVDEFVQHTMDAIQKDNLVAWEKRLRAQILSRLGLPVPKEWQDLAKGYLAFQLPKSPVFRLVSGSGNEVSRVTIADRFRLLLCDDKRKLKGFNLHHYDIVAKSIDPDLPLDELKAAVTAAAKATGIEGVPIELLSTVPWYPRVNGKLVERKKDKKHKVKSFLLKPGARFQHPYSHSWDIATRVPTDKDVFILISKFKGAEYNFRHLWAQDKRLAALLGVEMPPIYGYKTTETKPVAESDCTGVEYRVWRTQFFKELSEKHAAGLDMLQGLHAAGNVSWFEINRRSSNRHIAPLIKGLGRDHAIVQLYVKRAVAMRKVKRMNRDKFEALDGLYDRVEEENPGKATKLLNVLLEKYPLVTVTHSNDFSDLWDNRGKEVYWMQYIRAIDALLEGESDE